MPQQQGGPMAHPIRRPASSRASPLRLIAAPVSEAVAAFGAEVTEKLGRGGEDEDQLRGPLEGLLRTMARHIGVHAVPSRGPDQDYPCPT